MSKKAPRAPAPMQTASQVTASQADANRSAASDTLRLNSMDRSNPFGSAAFTRDANGVPTGVSTSFSAPLQGGFDAVTGAFTGMAGQLPTTAFNSTAAAPSTDWISRAFYDKGAALLAPQFDQARKAQDVQLTNRGLPMGSEARNIAEGNLAVPIALRADDKDSLLAAMLRMRNALVGPVDPDRQRSS